MLHFKNLSSSVSHWTHKFMITGYCTPGATRNEVEWLVCWWNECMPEAKNKCIIINYKSMAQYVHGTSVQQCVLDQLSGASVAQSTQNVMYHLLVHWKTLTSSNSASAFLPSTFTDCTNSHPPIPTTSTSSCCIISLHLGSRCCPRCLSWKGSIMCILICKEFGKWTLGDDCSCLDWECRYAQHPWKK